MKFNRLLIGSVMLGCGLSAMAVPAMRKVQTVTQPDGTTLKVKKIGDERMHFLLTEDGYLLAEEADGTYCYARANASGMIESTGVKALDAAFRSTLTVDAQHISDFDIKQMKQSPRRIPQSGVGLDDTTFPGKGSPKVLILIVQYSDYKFMLDDPRDYFESMLNEEGFSQYGGTGSCKDYFTENSNGMFTPQFDLYGPVTLPNKRSYYGGNDFYGQDNHPEEMVIHAIKSLDSTVDFSQYDNDGDGLVDNVYVIYAGQGEASYGTSDTVWPHSWDLSSAGSEFVVDGVTVSHYACSNEWQFDRPDGIGTFVHEFSHVMGLPDLYNTEQQTDYTPGFYSVMDYGPYNNDGRTPPCYGMYERNSLGWAEPIVIDEPMDCELEHILTSNMGYLIPTSKNTEFFLLENRQQAGWDEFLPGHGMLIWHIDFNPTRWEQNTVNNNPSHQYVDIEEAIGRVGQSDIVMAGYPFPGSMGVTSFTDDTKPSMMSWSKERLNMPVTEITEENGIIRFVVAGGASEAMEVPELHDTEMLEKSSEHFVAAWKRVANAVDYEVTVYATGQGEPETSSCDMGSGKNFSLTEGWTSSSNDMYSTLTNYGEASPSYKMASTGSFLLSPVFEGNVTSISYWRKGQNTDGSVLAVSGLVAGNWINIYTDAPASGEAKKVELTEIPAGVTQIMFEYTKDKGNVALDDVVITTGAGDQILGEYVDYSTQGKTTLRVDKLKEGCSVYKYQVRARGEKRVSKYSDLVTVELPVSGLKGVEVSTDAPEYFDMLGRRVLKPVSGEILIERRGTNVSKVVIP